MPQLPGDNGDTRAGALRPVVSPHAHHRRGAPPPRACPMLPLLSAQHSWRWSPAVVRCCVSVCPTHERVRARPCVRVCVQDALKMFLGVTTATVDGWTADNTACTLK